MEVNKVAEGIDKYGVGNYTIAIILTLFAIGVCGLAKFSYDTMVNSRATNMALLTTNTNLVESNKKLVESNAETVKQISSMATDMKDINYKLNNISNVLGLRPVLDSDGNIVGYTPVKFNE
jgi:hypothetical protein